jgi:hypothetical protein
VSQLAKGERGVIPLVAPDERAAQVSFSYLRDYFLESPVLREQLASEPTAKRIDLVNRISILCFPCTQRGPRALSIPAGLMSELAFFRMEGAADADVEIQASIRRGMLAFPSPKLVKISTPYLEGGVLHDDFTRAYGQDDPDLLVWQATALVMNPSIPVERLERERRLDPLRFEREYEGRFTDDLSACFDLVALRACVESGVRERSYAAEWTYVLVIDAASGERAGNDAFTAALAHADGDRAVLEVIRAWLPPFNPSGVIA